MLNTSQATTARQLGITASLANRGSAVLDKTEQDAEYLATMVANLTAMDASDRAEFIDRTLEHATAARDAYRERQQAAAQHGFVA